MSAQESYCENIGPQLKEGEGEIVERKVKAEATDKAKLKTQIAALGGHRSEFTKLGNYILGSSAAIITNVSLIVGLGSAQVGKGPIFGGLLTVALADNISNSLGTHLYKESEGFGGRQSSFASALNLLSRLLVSLSFIDIVLIWPTSQAIIIGIVWTLLLLTLISYLITRSNRENSISEILKHVLIAVIVIVLSRCIGSLIADYF